MPDEVTQTFRVEQGKAQLLVTRELFVELGRERLLDLVKPQLVARMEHEAKLRHMNHLIMVEPGEVLINEYQDDRMFIEGRPADYCVTMRGTIFISE